MTDEYIPTQYQFEAYRREVPDGTVETWAITMPISQLLPIDVGCYISTRSPEAMLRSAQHRWGVLENLWPIQADVQANRIERRFTIDGIDYQLDATGPIWIGPPRPGGPDHLRRGGLVR